MHGFKEIIFEYDPGFFASRSEPSIKIKINKNHVSYQEITRDFNGNIIKGPVWKTITNQQLFDDLTENIVHALYVEFPRVCDGDGTLITAKKDDGTKVEKYIQLSFYEIGLGHLADIVKPMLSGLKLPGFLIDPSENDEDDEEYEEPVISQDKIRKLLKTYGAADKEIDNFMHDLYDEDKNKLEN